MPSGRVDGVRDTECARREDQDVGARDRGPSDPSRANGSRATRSHVPVGGGPRSARQDRDEGVRRRRVVRGGGSYCADARSECAARDGDGGSAGVRSGCARGRRVMRRRISVRGARGDSRAREREGGCARSSVGRNGGVWAGERILPRADRRGRGEAGLSGRLWTRAGRARGM